MFSELPIGKLDQQAPCHYYFMNLVGLTYLISMTPAVVKLALKKTQDRKICPLPQRNVIPSPISARGMAAYLLDAGPNCTFINLFGLARDTIIALPGLILPKFGRILDRP